MSVFQLPFMGKPANLITQSEPWADTLTRANDAVPVVQEGHWQSLDLLREQLFAAADIRNGIRDRMQKMEQELAAADLAVQNAKMRLDAEIAKTKTEIE